MSGDIRTDRDTLAWEPPYGFTARNSTGRVALAHAVEAVRREVCGYGGEGRCDCKYGLTTEGSHPSGEQTGCPELRELVHRLLHRPESLGDVAETEAGGPDDA